MLLDDLSSSTAIPDAVQLSEVEKLVQGIPKMIGLLPDVLCRNAKVDGGRHVVALDEMVGALVRVRDRAEGVLEGSKGPVRTPLLSAHSLVNVLTETRAGYRCSGLATNAAQSDGRRHKTTSLEGLSLSQVYEKYRMYIMTPIMLLLSTM